MSAILNVDMSPNVESDNIDESKDTPCKQQQQQTRRQQQENAQSPQISGMTPSIITTINNTSPHLPLNHPSINNSNNNNNNNNCNTLTRTRRTNEPYESYIEDSFVGHWEREDDDPNYDYPGGDAGEAPDETKEEESALQRASAIEFDFDSFGPESFIYTPASTVSTKTTTTIKTTVPSTTENLSSDNTNHDGVNQEDNNDNQQKKHLESQQETPKPIIQESQKSCALNRNQPDYLVDPAQIDLKVIEPYKKVISHAGYCHHIDPSAPPPNPGEPAPAIIVFSACYLPDRSRRDYNYVMDHLFLYVLSSLHELIADDYILIYLHNTQPSAPALGVSSSSNIASNGPSSSSSTEEIQHPNNLPTFTWMKRCYQMIDRKLRKNLKILYLVKPTFWLKTVVIMCKPFISAKFSRKLRFVENMDGLKKCLPVDKLILPASAENI